MRSVMLGCVLVLLLTGCADTPGSDRGSPSATPSRSASSTPSTSPASAERWIAVIKVASQPGKLDALTQRLMDPLGTSLVVSPTDCFEGLPDRAGEGYLIGAVGESRSSVEGLVVDAGEEVAFSAKVTIVCTD